MIDRAWVVVANGTKVRMFRVVDNNLLQEVEGLVHPESHLRTLDLVSDKPGRSFDSFGEGRHHLSNESSPKEREAIFFAKMVADHLLKGFDQGEMKQIYLISSPSFLGHLNKSMHPNVKKIVLQEIDKDLTLKKPEEIRKHLPYVL